MFLCTKTVEFGRFYIFTCERTEVEDTHHRVSFLEGGAILDLPIFYLEGANSYLYRLHFCIWLLLFLASG